MHCEIILDEYREKMSLYERIRALVVEKLRACLDENHILVAGLESRIKSESSLVGKLELKGYYYHFLQQRSGHHLGTR